MSEQTVINQDPNQTDGIDSVALLNNGGPVLNLALGESKFFDIKMRKGERLTPIVANIRGRGASEQENAGLAVHFWRDKQGSGVKWEISRNTPQGLVHESDGDGTETFRDYILKMRTALLSPTTRPKEHARGVIRFVETQDPALKMAA